MELEFKKENGKFVAEFKVSAEFNIHIEKQLTGDLILKQRSIENGQYDVIEDFGYNKGGDFVIDRDVQGFIAPKWIKIESAVLPTLAVITTSGDVEQVN